MNLLIPDFMAFCKKNNFKLEYDDSDYISRMISIVPIGAQKRVLDDYLLEWRKGMAEELDPSKKQREGRSRANIWIKKRCFELIRNSSHAKS